MTRLRFWKRYHPARFRLGKMLWNAGYWLMHGVSASRKPPKQ